MDDNKLAKLNSLYDEGEQADKSLFTEQRSNWLLYIGNHFNKQASSLHNFIRGFKQTSEKKGLRLVKNHLGSICDKLMAYTVINHNPDVVVEPKNKTEVQDRKAADIANSVYKHIKKANNFEEMKADLAADFVVAGEIITYTSFNPEKGEFLGMQPTEVDELGQVLKEAPKFSGEVEIKRLESFNVFRDPTAKRWEDCKWIGHREMVALKDLKAQFGDNPEAIEKLTESADEDFVVFDAQKSGNEYSTTGNTKVLVKKVFYRPCLEYPEGYFYYYTTDLILAEGTLNKQFPITYRAYQKVSTSPRGFSIIRRLRTPQLEVNRISSTISESQINFRQKLLISSGTKLSHGGTSNGVVGIKYSGQAPTVMQGQSGEQYLATLDHQISEMYRLSHVPEEEQDKNANADPNALLFRSLKDKKRFSQKSDIFESFLIEVCEKALDCARLFYNENNIIPMVDAKDRVNIAEFKNINKLCYSLDVKPMSQDIQSMLGEQISISHILQYSQNLPEEYVAQLVASMPFLKDSDLAEEITSDIRKVDDVFAAIERGQALPVSPYDNHKYFIKKITGKMVGSAYQFLDPQVQALYQQRLQQHEQMDAENAKKMQMAQMGMIPAGGGLITVSGLKDGAGEVIRLPHDALLWLIEKLNEQGGMQHSYKEEIGNEGAMADIAGMIPQTDYFQNTQQIPTAATQAPQGMY